jgi:hypothetical protein
MDYDWRYLRHGVMQAAVRKEGNDLQSTDHLPRYSRRRRDALCIQELARAQKMVEVVFVVDFGGLKNFEASSVRSLPADKI